MSVGANQRPAPGAPRAYQFPRTTRLSLPNGLTIHIAAMHRLPTVTALVTIDAGAEHDPLDQVGLAALTNAALAEGTERLDGDALADAFERLGGTLDVDIIWSRAECSTTVLAPHFPEALQLLGEVVRRPAFPASEVDRLREERLAELLQLQAEPRGLADDMFARAIYSDASRYALPEGGDRVRVQGLTVADVARFHRERYAPSRASLIVVGDVEADRVVQLAAQVFGDWKSEAAPVQPIVAEPATRERRVHLVMKDEAPQSELRLGHTTIPRVHPDFYAVAIMNGVLGGLFNSRINLNLREEHGYTYGAFSSFDWRRLASAFEVSTAVRSDVTADAVREILLELTRMREAGVTASELALARDYMVGVFPIRFETTEAIAGAIAMRESFALEESYFDSYRERMAAVTPEDVQRVAREYLDLDRLQIVVVGDAAVVRASLEALNGGTLTCYGADLLPVRDSHE